MRKHSVSILVPGTIKSLIAKIKAKKCNFVYEITQCKVLQYYADKTGVLQVINLAVNCSDLIRNGQYVTFCAEIKHLIRYQKIPEINNAFTETVYTYSQI